MSHGDAREGKWRGNWRMELVASTIHTTSERGVSSITTADARNSDASSLLNWRLRRFKWTLPFRRKTKSGFCAFAIRFQLASTRLSDLSSQQSSRLLEEASQHPLPTPNQGRIKLFGAPRQWKHFRPLFQAVFLSGGGITPPDW